MPRIELHELAGDPLLMLGLKCIISVMAWKLRGQSGRDDPAETKEQSNGRRAGSAAETGTRSTTLFLGVLLGIAATLGALWGCRSRRSAGVRSSDRERRS